jgi:predicted enzyme related to lactoylglutathione lyase
MISGVHALIYSRRAEQARAFFRDQLKLPAVDAGQGWLIFALPPAELAFHPADASGRHELFLMCDDLDATLAELKAKGAELAAPITEQPYGRMTSIRIPGDLELGLYQPKHPTAIGLRA